MNKLYLLVTGCLASLLLAGNANSALDLRNANVHRLDNGLTLLLLEDRTFPVVSVQTVYRVGARYLAPHKRTVGWTVPVDPPEVPPTVAPPAADTVSRTAASAPSAPTRAIANLPMR